MLPAHRYRIPVPIYFFLRFQFPLYYIILVSSVDTNLIVMEMFDEINWHVLRTEQEQESREQHGPGPGRISATHHDAIWAAS